MSCEAQVKSPFPKKNKKLRVVLRKTCAYELEVPHPRQGYRSVKLPSRMTPKKAGSFNESKQKLAK
jgi:hypothetical protein